jgi:fatty-acyl-CoA synthase
MNRLRRTERRPTAEVLAHGRCRVSDSGAGAGLNRTVADALGAVARSSPDRPALVASGRRTTYGALDREVSRLAAGLRRRGLSRGGPVVLLQPSGWEAIRGFFAVARAGGVAVPLNPRLKARELRLVLEDIQPAMVIAARRVPGNDVEVVLDELRRIPSLLPETVFVEPDPPAWATSLAAVAVDEAWLDARAAAGPGELAAVFYTTGTTGTPKGVMHTHAGLLDSFQRMQELYASFFSGSAADTVARMATLLWRYRARLLRGLGPQVWMTPLPSYSIAGFRFALHALLGGHRLVLMERFQPRAMLDLVEHERVTILAVTPSMLEVALDVAELHRHDLSSLLVVGLGAAPTAPGLVRRARATLGCAVVVGYGATETGGGVLVTRLEDGERELAETVGRPFPGAEVRIVDEQRREVPAGVVGELACRSTGLMAGYHGQTSATAEAVDEDGWYYTGLAARDGQGYIRILGRKRDLIIRGGHNVVPAEVEAVLLEHPSVAGAAVVGVPDRVAGETIWAFIVPAEPSLLDLVDLRLHCARRLDAGKVPDQLQLLEELPVTETGEIRRMALRALAELQVTERRRTGRRAADKESSHG